MNYPCGNRRDLRESLRLVRGAIAPGSRNRGDQAHTALRRAMNTTTPRATNPITHVPASGTAATGAAGATGAMEVNRMDSHPPV